MIREIVAHGSPVHLDEFVGLILLRRYGEDKLPGISTASFRTLTANDNIGELERKDDTVLLGCGTGPFDEHVFNGDKSKKDECCATLVARFLDINEDPRWNKILKYTLHTDKHPPTLVLDLASSVIRFQKQGLELNAVIDYIEMTVQAVYAEQEKFFAANTEEIRREELVLGGDLHWMAVLENDNEALIRQARFLGAAVVVVKNSSGHVVVLTTNDFRLDMRDTIRTLRFLEQMKKGKVLVSDWEKLEQEGAIEEVPEWFFHKEAGNVLNGSRSRQDIPATGLTLSIIVEAVKTGLEGRFEPRKQSTCLQGRCAATRNNPCSWYQLGLIRCRTIRIRQYRGGK